MRSWRKLHSSVLESGKLAQVSDGAATLFFMLVVAQDDTGYYPWEPVKVKRLTAARPWSLEEAGQYAEELAVAGLCKWEEGGLVLYNGTAFNGTPRKDVEPEVYPRQRHVDATLTPSDVAGALEQSRADLEQSKKRESGAKAPHAPTKKTYLPITPEYIEEMVVEFSSRLGGNGQVRERIEEAMNHKAMDKRKDKRLYLRTWLRRDARATPGGSHATPGRNNQGDEPYEDWLAREQRRYGT